METLRLADSWFSPLDLYCKAEPTGTVLLTLGLLLVGWPWLDNQRPAEAKGTRSKGQDTGNGACSAFGLPQDGRVCSGSYLLS